MVRQIADFDRTKDVIFSFFDDHVFQRHLADVQSLPEVDVVGSRLRKRQLPGLTLGERLRVYALSDLGQESVRPDRGHVRGFRHHPYVREGHPFVVGENDLLLQPRGAGWVFVARRAVFGTDHQTWTARRERRRGFCGKWRKARCGRDPAVARGVAEGILVESVSSVVG